VNARILARLVLIAVCCFVTPASAIELTEPEGAAHGYPGLCDINGKNSPTESFGNGCRTNGCA